MKKILLTSISSITLLSGFTLSTNTYAANYSNIDEAKKEHPNADFKVNKKDGTFSYTYDNNDTQSPLNKKKQESQPSNNQINYHPYQNNSVQLSPYIGMS